MLRLQAAREAKPGLQCGPDSKWQQEFDAAFPYVETNDQLDAINDARGDMERAQPMDRLICGDVGYGKTEVAMRAAFKCVDNGRQVAVLVPTTVLAEQHFRTFTTRMAEFPVNIEVLSRFRTKAEQRRILEDMAGGAVDIVVGTHRLVQKDVKFQNIGLLIIDEEQRFGVEAKEMLKQLRLEIDVMTLTATPIPAHTAHVAAGHPRHLQPHDRSPGSTGHRNAADPVRLRTDSQCDHPRDESRWPGLLRPQPCAQHPVGCRPHSDNRARSHNRHRARGK